MPEQRKMDIPAEVRGRPVSNRGVHLQPFGFHDVWLKKADYWIGLLQSMHMSWCLALSESDALYRSGAAKVLLDGGIIPVVRFSYQFGDHFDEMAAIDQLVSLYAKYSAPLIVQFANEPFDIREWRSGEVPPDDEAWGIIRSRWHEAERIITERGAIAGFPDGPCYRRNPFTEIGDPGYHWQEGRAIYLGHHYGKGRPLDYPRDDVSRYGTPLTMDEYRAQLDDYADDPAWNEGEHVLGLMNQQRREWANPNLTPLDDDTCWRGWEKVLQWSRDAFGFEVQMALTEGGWVPRDRAGSNPQDIRWPYSTLRMVARKTLQMFETDCPLLFQTPWLLADEDMGGTGWPFDAWVGWAYEEKYGREKPVIAMLRENPPKSQPQPHPQPKPEPQPTPPPQPNPEPAGIKVDPRIQPFLTLDTKGSVYKLEEIAWMDAVQSAGLHHIFLDIVDQQGKRLAGEQVRVSWADGEAITPIEEKPGEPWGGNLPMSATMGSYAVRVVAAAWASDAVAGLGMGTPQEPKVKHPTSFGLRFVRRPPAEEPEPTPEPKPEPEPEPKPEPKPEPAGPKVDPRVQSFLTVDVQGTVYKLEEIAWMDAVQSDGRHHIFLDIVDEQGKRLVGEQVRVSWADGEAIVPIEEKPGEPWGGNFPMFAVLGAYAVQVEAAAGASDGVSGLGMGTPQEPNVKHHTSFGLRFRKLMTLD